MRLTRIIKIGAAGAAMLLASAAFAESGFKLPVHYTLEMVDGADKPENYSRFSRTVTLSPGRHQIVVLFKDTFQGGADARLVQSSNPIVIDLMNLKPNQTVTFDYDIPSSLAKADVYSRTQKIRLVDTKGNPIPASDASYFIMTSENGFVLGRDYRQELMSINRLYAPAYVEGGKRGIGMTSYGAPTIEATNDRTPESSTLQTLDDPGLSMAQEGTMETSSRGGSSHGGASYNQLVRLYNSADDATKLKFVKYVMSH
jgi:uncharacterized protein YccT (UPF0319 family)